MAYELIQKEVRPELNQAFIAAAHDAKVSATKYLVRLLENDPAIRAKLEGKEA